MIPFISQIDLGSNSQVMRSLESSYSKDSFRLQQAFLVIIDSERCSHQCLLSRMKALNGYDRNLNIILTLKEAHALNARLSFGNRG